MCIRDRTVDIGGQRLSGDFAFEQASDEGSPTTILAIRNAGLSIGAAGASLDITEGEGELIVLPTGVAGRFEATARAELPGVDLEADVEIEFNQTSDQADVDASILIGDEVVDIVLDGGNYVRVALRGAELDVLGQTLSGDFTFEQSGTGADAEIGIAVTNAELALGDGLVTVTATEASFVINDAGIAGSFSGSVGFGIDNISIAANLDVEINTTNAAVSSTVGGVALDLEAGTYVRVAGQSIAVDVLGQTLTGDLALERTVTANGTEAVRFAIAQATLNIGAGADTFVAIENASGGFIVTDDGVAGSLTIADLSSDVTFDLPDLVGLTATEVTVEFNTFSAPVSDSFVVPGDPTPTTIELDLPAGSFFRVSVEGLNASLTAGGLTVAVSGNIAVSQSTNDANETVTALGFSEFSASIAHDGANVAVSDGEGVFVITADGVAGLVSGEVGVDLGEPNDDGSSPISAGGRVTVRINSTGAEVDETVDVGNGEIPIRYGVDEVDVLEISFSELSLNIGDFVTIEGAVTFDGDAFAGTNLEVFLGQGPPRLDSGDLNPLATGVLLTDATIGLVRVGDEFALHAEGRVELVGIDGVLVEGTAVVDVNTTGTTINRSIAIAGSSADPVEVVFATTERVTSFVATADITVLGQTLEGTFAFDQAADGTLTIVASQVGLSLGDGANGVAITGASGVLLVDSTGIAGQVAGNVALTLPDVEFGAGFAIAVNTTNAAVDRTFSLNGDTVDIDLEAGPYLRVDGDGIDVTIAGQSFTGDVAFEQATDLDSGESIVTVGFSNVTLDIASGDDSIISLTGGEGLFIVAPAGLAGRLGGTVELSIPDADFDFEGTFSVEVNTTNLPIDEMFVIGGEVEDLILERSNALRVVGEGVELRVAGQVLTADFAFEQVSNDDGGADVIRAVVSNGSIDLGDGAVTVDGIDGALFLFADDAGEQQLAAQLGADVDIDIAGVTLTGDFGVAINTSDAAVDETFDLGPVLQELSVEAGPFVNITGVDAELTVQGQTITADFSVTRTVDTLTGATTLVVGVTEGSLQIGDGTTLVEVDDIDGVFIRTADGPVSYTHLTLPTICSV